MNGRFALAFAVTCFLALFAFASTAAAMATIGQVAPSSTLGGGCGGCSLFQNADTGPGAYSVPFNGVITQFRVRTGSSILPGDSVQLRIFRPGGAPPWTLAAESAQFAIPNGTNAIDPFGARIAVHAGDLIGVRVNYNGNTAAEFASASSSDQYFQIAGDPAVGDVISGVSGGIFSNFRLNIAADVEADTDGDGFGDDSQDLCVGVAGANDGCPGTLVGSPLINAPNGGTGCGGPCTIFASGVPGASFTVPTNGILMHWGVKGSTSPANYALRVLRPAGAGYDVISETSTASIGFSTNAIVGGGTHLAVKAGDLLALSASGTTPEWFASGAGSYSSVFPQPALGSNTGAPIGPFSGHELLYAGVVEPDADGDGFGDITEDLCPTDASIQTACPEVANPPAGTNPTPAKPVLSGLKPEGKKLRLSTDGLKFNFNLTEASVVKFDVAIKLTGRLQGTKCKKPTAQSGKAKKCTYFSAVRTFSQTSATGTNSFVLTGQFKIGKKLKSLKPGSYRLSATPTSVASALTGTVAQTAFTVSKR